MTWSVILCLLALAAWIGVLIDRGGFWRADRRLDATTVIPGDIPDVVAVIPARNEAPTIGLTVEALMKQSYPGTFRVIVADDNSTDKTAEAALRGAASVPGGAERLSVVSGKPLPHGWSGKLWAVEQGVAEAYRQVPDAKYILLTDADIEFAPGTLRRLVSQSERNGLTLASLMVKLRCRSFWERLLIPAFVFFFQKLYPFGQVGDPNRSRAGAAGGCMLVQRKALDSIGGLESIRGALIDDCTLAARLKGKGPIFLGLASRTQSLRPYDNLGEIWSMVARTAYVQLNRSPLMLLATVIGMILLYLILPLSALIGFLSGAWMTGLLGLLGWLGMTALYYPTLRLYRRSFLWGLTLPVAGFLYTLMTIDSARRHYAGRGGEWKGRSYEGSNAGDSAVSETAATVNPTAPEQLLDDDALAQHVTEITRASGTSFYGAMRILPKPRRQAMYALYAFCRVVDDIVDAPGAEVDKMSQLAFWRDEIEALYDPHREPTHPVARALDRPRRMYHLTKRDFIAIIEGMEMDAPPRVRIADMPALEGYCDRVACAVGRQSNRIFGVAENLVEPIARHTGLALQLINVLRDVAEDAKIDRLYLPESRLRAHGLDSTDDLNVVIHHPATAKVCAELASKAAAEVAEAERLQAQSPHRTIRPAIIMLKVYKAYLKGLNQRGWQDLDAPVDVSKAYKVAVALRHGLF